MTITPAARRPQLNIARLVEELMTEAPGTWREVARYPADRRKSAWSRGSETCTRYPVLDYAVEPDEDGVALYFSLRPDVS